MENLPDILLLVSLFTISVAAYGSISALVGLIRARIRLRDTSIQRFETVLASSDIAVFDEYLNEVIGEFSLQSYVTNPTVAKRVDQFVHKLRDFVGSESDVREDIRRSDEVPDILTFKERLVDLPPSLSQAAEEIYFGEIWNGLARLRREIEIKLRDLAMSVELPLKGPSSAGRLLRALEARQLINRSAATHLEYAIAIANKAIHGFDVGPAEAEGALAFAATGFRIMDSEGLS